MPISCQALFYGISTAFLPLFDVIFTSYLQVVDNTGLPPIGAGRESGSIPEGL